MTHPTDGHLTWWRVSPVQARSSTFDLVRYNFVTLPKPSAGVFSRYVICAEAGHFGCSALGSILVLLLIRAVSIKVICRTDQVMMLGSSQMELRTLGRLL